MKKNVFKRGSCFFLALLMLMSMSIPALASDTETDPILPEEGCTCENWSADVLVHLDEGCPHHCTRTTSCPAKYHYHNCAMMCTNDENCLAKEHKLTCAMMCTENVDCRAKDHKPTCAKRCKYDRNNPDNLNYTCLADEHNKNCIALCNGSLSCGSINHVQGCLSRCSCPGFDGSLHTGKDCPFYDPNVCIRLKGCEASEHSADCAEYVPPCTGDDNCTAPDEAAHSGNCPKLCNMSETCPATVHKDGCLKTAEQQPEPGCSGDENCTAPDNAEHSGNCPKLCNMSETCPATVHKEGCAKNDEQLPEPGGDTEQGNILGNGQYYDNLEEAIRAGGEQTILEFRGPVDISSSFTLPIGKDVMVLINNGSLSSSNGSKITVLSHFSIGNWPGGLSSFKALINAECIYMESSTAYAWGIHQYDEDGICPCGAEEEEFEPSEADPIASVDGTGYASLQAAFNAACQGESTGSVTLNEAVTLTSPVSFSSNVTLTVSEDASIASTADNAFAPSNGAVLRLNGLSLVEVKELCPGLCVYEEASQQARSGSGTVCVAEQHTDINKDSVCDIPGCNAVLDNGDTGEDTSGPITLDSRPRESYSDLQAAIMAAANNDTIYINSSITLESSITVPAGKALTFDFSGGSISAEGSARISGGSQLHFMGLADLNAVKAIASGACVWYKNSVGHVYTEHSYVLNKCSHCEALRDTSNDNKAAYIHSTGEHYDTLAEAVSAAASGDVIVLLKAADLGRSFTVSKNLTIDANGYDLDSGAGAIKFSDLSCYLNIINSHCTFEWVSSAASGYCVKGNTNGSFTIRGRHTGTADCMSTAQCTFCGLSYSGSSNGSHSFVYTESGRSIIETCSNKDANGKACEHRAVATLTAPVRIPVYNGKEQLLFTIGFTGKPWQGEMPTVTYTGNKKAVGDVPGEMSVKVRTSSGTYTIYSVSHSYEILPNELKMWPHQSYYRDSDEGLWFTIETSAVDFTSILSPLSIYTKDGSRHILDVHSFKTTFDRKGNLMIRVPEWAMESLSNGTYLLEASLSADGSSTVHLSADANFRVTYPRSIPATGDTSNILLWAGLLVSAAAAMGVILLLLKKSTKKKNK